MARDDKSFYAHVRFPGKCEENFARAIKSAGGVNGKGCFRYLPPKINGRSKPLPEVHF